LIRTWRAKPTKEMEKHPDIQPFLEDGYLYGLVRFFGSNHAKMECTGPTKMGNLKDGGFGVTVTVSWIDIRLETLQKENTQTWEYEDYKI